MKKPKKQPQHQCQLVAFRCHVCGHTFGDWQYCAPPWFGVDVCWECFLGAWFTREVPA